MRFIQLALMALSATAIRLTSKADGWWNTVSHDADSAANDVARRF